MVRVISCLVTQHDWRLLLLAGAACLVTSFAAINLFRQARSTKGRTRYLWLIVTGICAGYGIWATHFIAMLAYSPGPLPGYDLSITLLSLLAAVVITSTGFALATAYPQKGTTHLGGAIVGAGIAVMHYLGMAAFEVPGHIEWDWDLSIASIVFGVGFSIAAVHALMRAQSMQTSLAGTAFMAAAILSLHFTAMGAVRIVTDAGISITALSLSPNALAIAIASGAAGVLGMSLIATVDANSRQQLIAKTNADIALQAELLDKALANIPQGVSMFDKDQRLIFSNRRYAEIYELPPELLKPGTTLAEIFATRIERGLYGDVETGEFLDTWLPYFTSDRSDVFSLADGRFILITRQPTSDGGSVTTHEDITERREAEARITHLAHHDVLTDLPNRALLRERLEEAVTEMEEIGDQFAILALDLDRFKEVNDTLGHPIGDQLLKAITQRLRSCVRETDTIARLGGDEFSILQKTSDPGTDSTTLAERIQQLLAEPFELEGHQVNIGASIGIAIAPEDGSDPDTLLKNADLALYRAKADNDESYHFFEPEMDRRIQKRRLLEHDLRNALMKGEFLIYYQPLLNLESDEICGFEALLRWDHPERGIVPPNDFITLAEETGLIKPIGEWVLRQACADAMKWPDHLKIAVNISPTQLKLCDLAEIVIHTLAATGLKPERLELEITESVMLENTDSAFRLLTRLHDIGVRIALDDFGTGYSSLSMLRRFPFDKIKIDRSFVSDLSLANVNALAVVRSVAQLGISLGMATTAEGVETKEQLEHVRAEGCTELQGYYVCRPSPAREIDELIQKKCLKSASAA